MQNSERSCLLMPLIPGICTQCGATLSVDQSNDCMICPYCHTTFIVQKAINQFNNTYNINAKNVYIQENTQKDFVIVAGILKKYNGESQEVTIPNNVVEIGDDVFSGMEITKIIIPNSVKRIGKGAFKKCLGLNKIIIPDSVTEINCTAFSNCENLVEVKLSKNLQKIKDWTFSYCYKLRQIDIPDNITFISDYAFYLCKSLKTIVLKNIKYIGSLAFSGCSNIEYIEISPNTQWLLELSNDGTDFPQLQNIKASTSTQIYFAVYNINSPFSKSFWSTASIDVKEAAAKKHRDSPFAKAYYKSQGRCIYCGGYFSIFGTCKECRKKKQD